MGDLTQTNQRFRSWILIFCIILGKRESIRDVDSSVFRIRDRILVRLAFTCSNLPCYLLYAGRARILVEGGQAVAIYTA